MRSLPVLLALFVCATATPSLAAAVVTATPARPTPTQAATFAGTGFAASEAIDVYYDTYDVKLVVSSASGAFSTSVQIPQSTAPGAHTLTAVGRRAGDAAQAAVIVSTPWRQFGFGTSHRNWNPFESTLSGSDLGTLWINRSLQGNGSTPTVVYPNVYVTTQKGVAALNPATGDIVWKVLSDQLFYASPMVLGNVFVASSSGNVLALNPTTGATVWSTALGGNIYSSLTVAGAILYVGNFNSKFYALNASTGAILWAYTTGDHISGTASVANGIVYFGSSDTKVYALNAKTGAFIWSYTTDGPIESSPAVVNGTVYIGAGDGKVYAFSADDGSLRWAYSTAGASVGPVAVVSGTVYAASNKIYAIDAATGTTTKWTFSSSAYAKYVSVANNTVYFTDVDGNFYALSADSGSLQNAAKLGATNLGAPAISDGVLYLNSFSGGATIRAVTSNVPAAARRPRQPPKPSDLHPDMSLKASR